MTEDAIRLRQTNTRDVLELFAEQVEAGPCTPAVDEIGTVTTYEQLRAHAFQLASAIQTASGNPSPRILIAMRPSASAYAAMIAVLTIGGTFCPIDITVAVPPARNGEIAVQFNPDVVLYERSLPTFLDSVAVTTPRLDVSGLRAAGTGAHSLDRSDVAYVAFTSGTTGTPKGVKVSRRGFSHFLEVARTYFALTLGERWGQFSNLGYDLGVMDVFMALTQGGTLIPLDVADRLRPAAAIRQKRIHVWQSVPSAVDLMIKGKQLTPENVRSLRVASFCGEPLREHHLASLFAAHPQLHVFNTYGATETVGFNTLNHLTLENYRDSCSEPSVAIGDCVPGWEIYLRGGESQDEGEITVASAYLAAGYWGDEERTRAAFREVDLGSSALERCYFTGDRGVRRGARLYCVGRMDRQVKIRGERVELDEIDSRLRAMGFSAAYTVYYDDQLHSFVESTENVDVDQIRAGLLKALPFHAVPGNISVLPSLPRNANGKIDRVRLQGRIAHGEP